MLTDRKYKSDKILRPVVIVLTIAMFVVNFFSVRKGILTGLLLIWIALTLGIMVYRFNKEGNKRQTIYSLLAILFFIILIFSVIVFKKIKL